jgi:predicted nuclease of predicted toxin-antitoxin system
VGRRLADAGHSVTELRDHLPADSADPLVIAKAEELDAVLVSLNGDFADITAYPPARHLGIIALQIHNHPETVGPIVELLLRYLAAHSDRRDLDGKLLIVEPHRIRIRT